jgi:hypothetical protein
MNLMYNLTENSNSFFFFFERSKEKATREVLFRNGVKCPTEGEMTHPFFSSSCYQAMRLEIALRCQDWMWYIESNSPPCLCYFKELCQITWERQEGQEINLLRKFADIQPMRPCPEAKSFRMLRKEWAQSRSISLVGKVQDVFANAEKPNPAQ